MEEKPFDRDALHDYYEAQKAVEEGMSAAFASLPGPDRKPSTVPPTFEEYVDELFNGIMGQDYGYYGRCEATAKTTGERCRQPATGDHRKCHYHGGADGSGIGAEQVDRQQERFEQQMAELETEHDRQREQTQELLDELDENKSETDADDC